MQAIKHIFITGTNRGLGKSLVRHLIKEHPDVELHVSSRGDSAQFQKQWTSEFPNIKIHTYQINLNNLESIRENVRLIQEKKVILDTIVASAAFGCDYGQKIPTHQIAKNTLLTNVDSTINFIKEFLPLLSNKGRVVIVSSMMGVLQPHSQRLKNILTNPSLTEQEILQISRDYVESAQKQDEGLQLVSLQKFQTSSECVVSLLSSVIIIIVRKYLKEGQTSVILCPGWCKTDMGGKLATLSDEEGARRINKGVWIEQTNPSKFLNQNFIDFE